VRRAILLLAFCQAIWSFGGIVIKWTPLPATTLMPLALITGGLLLTALTPRRKLALPNWRLRAEALGFGLTNGLTNVLMAVAITMAGIGNAAFAYASLPLWLVLVARPIVGDRVPSRAIPALVLGGAGIALLLAAGRGAETGNQVLLGLLLALVAALMGSISALAGRRLVPAVGALPTAAWTMLSGGVLLLPLVDWGSMRLLAWWMVPVLLGWIGVHYVLAPLIYNRTSIVAPAFILAVATFVNPALSPVWGRVFYGERVALLAIVGLALALAANALLMFLLRPRRPPQPQPESARPDATVEAPATVS
jgi:drug/metabolite transporter (DMT)-like permease